MSAEHMKLWRQKNPERNKETNKKAQKRYEAKHPEKRRAHQKVAYHINHGNLVRPNICEHCGADQFTEASHTDYDKPLDVEWLCRPCHMKKDGLL